MSIRLAVGCALTLACGKGPAGSTDGGGAANGPALVSVMPGEGSDAWLHEPLRLVFDEPITAQLTATAVVAGTPVAATVSAEHPTTLAIAVDPAARGLGALELLVTGSVADAAGNTAPVAIDRHLVLQPWSGVTSSRGDPASAPALAIAGGRVLAAWTIGAPGGHRVVVEAVPGGALGDPLGTGDATSAAIAVDASGRPVVAWCDGGAVHVARWDGASWAELVSPGGGTSVALAAAPDPIVASFGANATVRVLAGDAWQLVGDEVAIASPIVGEPALAAGDRIAIGWIDTAGALRVYRHDAAWTALAPIALAAPPAGLDRMSLATRGDTVAVAWDQWAGSFGVLAAQVTGAAVTWTRLGHTLDVDVAGDALAPAIALDADGAPIVAWTEQIEGSQRGIVARWTGAWTLVGGVSFLGSATDVPSRPALALHAGGAPVVGWTAHGALDVARFNGPAVAAPGLATRTSITGCELDPRNPPALLSQTGCFDLSMSCNPTPHPGLVPYDVVVELWSDSARKRRWIGLPDGATMTDSATGAWTGPSGTMLVKEFALETTPGQAATRRPIETRFLVNDPQLGWQGFSYRWNAAGSDATLQPDQEETYAWPLADGTTLAHFYPSRGECLECHDGSYGPLLGLRPQQLQRWFDYDGVIADQLATLAQLGVGPASAAAPFVAPHDPSETWEHRMRGYMAGNCAHCHNPDHISIVDERYTTPLSETHLCSKLVPGSPEQSIVYQKVSSRPGMPPLGTLQVDPLAAQMLGNWIAGMTSCP